MTTRLWSNLTDGQSITFDPLNDVLDFDDIAIHAAQVAVTFGGTTSLSLSYGGKSVTLEMNPFSATQANILFAGGSKLLVGDDSTGTANDDSSNTLTGSAGNDQLSGAGGDDSLSGQSGDDLLNGASGNDTLNGGFGNDTAAFSGASSGYNFRLDGGNVVVTDTDSITGGNDGVDRLIRVEGLSFTDGTVQVIAPLVGLQVDAGGIAPNENPSVAALSDGGFVMTWTGGGPGPWSGGSPGSHDSYAQLFDASGAATGAAFRVNTTTAGDLHQVTSVAAGLADGGFAIAWQSSEDGNGTGIYAQLYDASGAAVGAEFRVNTATAGNQFTPAIAAVSDGGFVVTWFSLAIGGAQNSLGIHAQRYDGDGVALGAEFTINSTAANGQVYPSIAALPGGGFVAAWFSDQDGISSNIYARRFDANGSAVGGEFQVNTLTANFQGFPKIAALPDDGFVVTWSSEGQDGSGSGVYAQRFDDSGAAVGTEFRVNTTTTGDQYSPRIAGLPDGSFVVTWHSTQAGGFLNIYAQRYDASGVALGTEFRVNTPGNGMTPSIAPLADGGYVVGWQFNSEWGAPVVRVGDIYARLYDADGVAAGAQFQVNVASEFGGLLTQLIGDGGANVIAWSDTDAVDLDGAAGNDTLTGGAGNDIVTGGTGADRLIGGAGDDHYEVDNAGDVVVEGLDSGTDTIQSSVSFTLPSNVENLILTDGAVNGTGNALENYLIGNSGANSLDGGAGNDTFVGGAGNDTFDGGAGDDFYYVDNAGDLVVEGLDAGTDTVQSSVSFTLPGNIENLILTGGALNGTGNALDNILVGTSAANSLAGGAGNDFYYVDNAGDVVFESPDAGTDTVQSSVSFTLSSNVENLILTGGALNGTGNNANNALTGNSHENNLVGGAGNDTLNGGDGIDTAVFTGSSTGYGFKLVGDTVVITDTDTVAGGNDGTEILIGIETASFTDRNVRIVGSMPEFRVNTTTAGQQLTPAIAALSDGGFVVSWFTIADSLRAQRYDAGGMTVGAEFVINSTPAGQSYPAYPSVAGLSGGGFVATWLSGQADGVGDVFVRRFDASGSAVGSEFQANTYTANFQGFPSVAALPDDGFVVTWSSDGDIQAQRYDATGAVGAEFLVNTTTAGTQDYSRIAALPDGSFVISWNSNHADAGGDVYAQRFDASGEALGTEFRVNTLTSGAQFGGLGLKIATLADGGYVVSWQSGSINHYDIYARRYDADGAAVGAEFLVNTGMPGHNEHASIAALADGGFVVVWNSGGSGAQDSYAQRYDASGATMGPAIRVNTTTASDQRTPVVAGLDDGGFVVTWQSDQDGSGTGIYGQRFDAQGIAIPLELRSVFEGTSDSDFIIGASGDDILGGAGGEDTVYGGTGDDRIDAGADDDVFDGGSGDNLLFGGSGSDAALLSGSASDYLIYVLSPGTETASFYDPGFGLEAGDIVNLVSQDGRIDRLVGVERVQFLGDPDTDADDVELNVTPAALLAQANFVRGENYLADINGTGLLEGGEDNDVLDGLDDDDTLEGGDGQDVLLGGAGNDSLSGGAGNDALNGQSGVDTMAGGTGNDRFIVDSALDVVQEVSGEGSADRVQTALTLYSLEGLLEVEILEFQSGAGSHGVGSAGANTLIGNAGADFLEGEAGEDSLLGRGGNDTLDGGLGNDTLDGGFGTDVVALSGNASLYTFSGEPGNIVVTTIATGETDVLQSIERVSFGNLPNQLLTPSGPADAFGDGAANTLTGTGGDDIIDALAGNDRVLGGAGNDYLAGSEGNDSLLGEAGEDTLDGGAGNDTLAGGAGNDMYLAGAGDVISETLAGAGAGFVDTVLSSVTLTLGANLENLVLVDGAGNLNGSGNALANRLTGNDGNNSLAGLAGSDTYVGGAGNDIYVLADAGDSIDGSGSDAGIDLAIVGMATGVAGGYLDLSATDWLEYVIYAGAGAVSLKGNDADNGLQGNAGNDTLDGGLGNDTLVGGAGNDSMTGGDGNDTYVVSAVGDVVNETGADAGDVLLINRTVDLSISFSGIEHVTLAGTSALKVTGDTSANRLTGNAAANTLDGGAGADTMAGGAGADLYVVDEAGDVVTETMAGAAGGIDQVNSAIDYSLAGTQIENAMLLAGAGNSLIGNALANKLTGAGNADTLDGGAGNDTLSGAGGNDTLDGGAGKNSLVGGAGDDIFYGRLINPTATTLALQDAFGEALNGGSDTVILGDAGLTANSADYLITIAANIENFDLVAVDEDAKINVTGNVLANSIIGSDGANKLDGAAGNDELSGGLGNDTLIGGAGDDRLDGDGGNDSLDGGLGNDTYGESFGDDIFVIAQSGDIIDVADDAGIDTVRIALAGNTYLDISAKAFLENVVFTGTGAVTIVGNDAANSLVGGAGADTIFGGLGDDTITVNSLLDSVSGGGGSDTVVSSIAYSIALLADVENLTLAGTASKATGNAGTNVLTGNAAANTLDGGAGTDTMYGGAGADTYVVDNTLDQAQETLAGAAGGIDQVNASADFTLGANIENATVTSAAGRSLTGNGLVNKLTGGLGSDTLSGGLGNDTLIGGALGDRFVFDQAIGTTNIDSITDFVSGIDRIVLDDDIFAALSIGVLAAGALHVFPTTAGTLDADDRIRYTQSTGELFYDADGSGVGAMVKIATLTTHPVISAGDFLVVA